MIELTPLLLEGTYDVISRLIANDIFKQIKKNKKNKFAYKKQYIINDEEDIYLNARVTINRKDELLGDYDYDIEAENDPDKDITTIEVYINSYSEPRVYSKLYPELIDTIRHEIEHILQYNTTDLGDLRGIMSKLPDIEIPVQHQKPKVEYFLSDIEIPAFLSGFHVQAKKRRIPIKDIMNYYLSQYVKLDEINENDKEFILKNWIKIYNKIYQKKIVY